MLTIFSAPKPFRDHIGRIQRNALRSWLALGSGIQVILLGSEDGLVEAADEFGLYLIQDIERNDQGTPLVSSIFAEAQSAAHHDLLCYVNADIRGKPPKPRGKRNAAAAERGWPDAAAGPSSPHGPAGVPPSPGAETPAPSGPRTLGPRKLPEFHYDPMDALRYRKRQK